MNTLKVTCENADELLAGFGAGARTKIQFGTAEAGPFSDLTTIALVSGTRLYVYEHLAGTSSTWYQFRFEDATGANANDYSAPFQVGDEQAGQLCSIYDVQQAIFGTATPSDSQRELLIEYIGQASRAIENYCGRWFTPHPLSGTTTLLFSVKRWDATLDVPVGVRSISSIGYATLDQSDTGGTYTTLAATNYTLQPSESQRQTGWPPTRIVLLWTGALRYWWPGLNTVTVTGSFGFASVPPDIQGVAQHWVTKAYIGKETAAPAIAVGPEGTVAFLRNLSGDDRAILDGYRDWAALVA